MMNKIREMEKTIIEGLSKDHGAAGLLVCEVSFLLGIFFIMGIIQMKEFLVEAKWLDFGLFVPFWMITFWLLSKPLGWIFASMENKSEEEDEDRD